MNQTLRELSDNYILASFLSMVLGWIGGMIYFVCVLYLTSGWITDLLSISFWSAIFIVIAWLVFSLPLILFVNKQHQLFSLKVFPIFNTAFGALAFLILCGWMGFWKEPFYIGFGAFVGLVAGSFYSWILKRSMAV